MSQMKKREIVDECEDIIFTMYNRANKQAADGDDRGYLALFWIKYWIKTKPTSFDADHHDKTGIIRHVPLYVHPRNFAWAFNRSSEIGKESGSLAYQAIENVYELAGGKL